MITPKSFSHCDIPTCSGREDDSCRETSEHLHDASLPTRVKTPGTRATYSWAVLAEKQMREYGVDFRPPSVDESWSWVMDNSQFGSDGQWLPIGEGLRHERHALLLEYLPNARKLESQSIPRNLALQALAGAQIIQKALVRHENQNRHHVLVTKDSTVVWVDFDRALVLDVITEDDLVRFKKDLIEVHEMFFPSR